MLIISFFPSILDYISKIVGIQYPPATLFLISLIVIVIILYRQFSKISMLTNKIHDLVRTVAVISHELDEIKKIKNVVLLLAGQTLWKLGIQKVGLVSVSTIKQLIISPSILFGFVLYGIATVIWFKLLSISPFSVIYPLQSMAYIFGLLIAWFVFGEVIPFTRWLGCIIIIVGVYVISIK